jgi:hypothetical protein
VKSGRPRTPRGVRNGPRRSGRIAWLAAAALAVVAVLWWGLHRTNPAHAPIEVSAGTTPWGDVPAGLGAPEAYARGSDLSTAGRYVEALPLFHHAAAAQAAPWFVHLDYASVIHQYAMLPWNADHPRVAPRASLERIRAMQAALAELERSTPPGGSAADQAERPSRRARVFNTWGFPWDALQDFRAAGRADSARRNIVAQYERSLADPASSAVLF